MPDIHSSDIPQDADTSTSIGWTDERSFAAIAAVAVLRVVRMSRIDAFRWWRADLVDEGVIAAAVTRLHLGDNDLLVRVNDFGGAAAERFELVLGTGGIELGRTSASSGAVADLAAISGLLDPAPPSRASALPLRSRLRARSRTGFLRSRRRVA